MSLPIPDIAHILSQHKVPAETMRAIVADLTRAEADRKEANADDAPKAKNLFNVVLLDPDGIAPRATELAALVVTIPEGQDAGETVGRIHRAVYDQRNAAKRVRRVIRDMRDAASMTKRAFLKGAGVAVKTKEPVRVLVSDGRIA